MAYTSTDLSNVEDAIRAIVSGKRVVRCSIGDKVFEFAQADLTKLRELKGEILSEIQTPETRPRFFLTRSDKGL
ncbi:MAG: hypothetical protein JW943_14705 [Deltaproteobacteria bacterium]|nr:hypothetical protein [Deltaproteobacteria bacterium]